METRTITLSIEEYKHLDKLLTFLAAGIQLYVQGWQPDIDVVSSTRKKLFQASIEEKEDA